MSLDNKEVIQKLKDKVKELEILIRALELRTRSVERFCTHYFPRWCYSVVGLTVILIVVQHIIRRFI